MSFLDNLYKEIILEHYKNPRNYGILKPATISREGLNPSCGDELEIFLLVEDGRIADIKFRGEGCAISKASTSLMTVAIKGKTIGEAAKLAEQFKEMIRGKTVAEELGDLSVLQGVAKLPARVKCATLSWITLEQALAELS